MLTNDPGMGVIRHVDAGYDRAVEVADRARRAHPDACAAERHWAGACRGAVGLSTKNAGSAAVSPNAGRASGGSIVRRATRGVEHARGWVGRTRVAGVGVGLSPVPCALGSTCATSVPAPGSIPRTAGPSSHCAGSRASTRCVKLMSGLVNERAVRLLFLGSAIRVDERQLSGCTEPGAERRLHHARRRRSCRSSSSPPIPSSTR